MPAPYSDDLRQKAVDAVKRGERKKDVSEILVVCQAKNCEFKGK